MRTHNSYDTVEYRGDIVVVVVEEVFAYMRASQMCVKVTTTTMLFQQRNTIILCLLGERTRRAVSYSRRTYVVMNARVLRIRCVYNVNTERFFARTTWAGGPARRVTDCTGPVRREPV